MGEQPLTVTGLDEEESIAYKGQMYRSMRSRLSTVEEGSLESFGMSFKNPQEP